MPNGDSRWPNAVFLVPKGDFRQPNAGFLAPGGDFRSPNCVFLQAVGGGRSEFHLELDGTVVGAVDVRAENYPFEVLCKLSRRRRVVELSTQGLSPEAVKNVREFCEEW